MLSTRLPLFVRQLDLSKHLLGLSRLFNRTSHSTLSFCLVFPFSLLFFRRCFAVTPSCSFSRPLQYVASLACGRVARSCLPSASCVVLPSWVDELPVLRLVSAPARAC